jgi:polygalacturonase
MIQLTRRHFLASAGIATAAFAARRPLTAQTLSATPAGSAATNAPIDAILARIHPPTFPNRDFFITDFGANPGAADARPAFLEAIRACNASGGGRVVVPRGVWNLAGPLHLKSNVRLHLDDDAHLRFKTDDPGLYLPAVLTRWEGTELFNYSPFIYAYQACNIAITGAGLIDGNAHDTFVKWRPDQGAAQKALRKMGADGVSVSQRIFGEGHWLRPPLVQFFGCSNVLLEGPRFIDSPFWVAHAVCSDNITVRGIHVDSPHINSDGFDPESCADVLIEDCVFKTGDDCVAIKSGRDQDAWRIGRPTENVIIRRCEMHAPAAGSGLAIGSEMSGGVRNVFAENLRMGRARTAINIKSNPDRGGFVENVNIRGVAVENTDALILVTTGYHGYRGGNFPPRFRDFVFENIRCDNAIVPISTAGVPAAKLENVTLRNIDVTRATKPAHVEHVVNYTAENVMINGKPWQPS